MFSRFLFTAKFFPLSGITDNFIIEKVKHENARRALSAYQIFINLFSSLVSRKWKKYVPSMELAHNQINGIVFRN